MTTGAAQTLWRTARRLPGKRVLIAGNGPLNLQLANELLDGGAEVVAVVEARGRRPRCATRPTSRDGRRLPAPARGRPALPVAPDAARVPMHLRLGRGQHRPDRRRAHRRSPHDIASAETRRFEVDVVCLG